MQHQTNKKHIQRPIMRIVLFTTKVCSLVQIKHKGDYLLGYKLYLHPFDRVEGRRTKTGQSVLVQFIDPVDNQLNVLFVFYYFLNNK